MDTKNIEKKLIAIFTSILTIAITTFFYNLNQKDPNNVIPTIDKINVVTEIVDGDTIKVITKEGTKTVRLIGIDTPETKHPSKPIQCYGSEASVKLKELVLNKEVIMEKDISETDQYGRLLRYIYIDNELVNETMVNQGYAFATEFPPDIKFKDKFDEAEIYAKTNKLGLWNPQTCNGER